MSANIHNLKQFTIDWIIILVVNRRVQYVADWSSEDNITKWAVVLCLLTIYLNPLADAVKTIILLVIISQYFVAY